MFKLGRFASVFLFFLLLAWKVQTVQAEEVLGIHILNPYELDDVVELLKTDKTREQWSYVTIPFGLEDINKKTEWQEFFNKCREHRIIPIVRLVTRPNGPTWAVPTKRNIVDLSRALSSLEWPNEQRIVILFNETNHAKEWGGKIDPYQYAEVLRFGLDWFKTEKLGYTVLPAAMDLAAPNGSETMEAFTYWKKVFEHDRELVDNLDAWNSHSYPNPGFSSAPTRTGQNSLRGFEHELTFLKQYSPREWGVYITETGWMENSSTGRYLTSYYQYAQKNIWSDPRIKAVTPFLLNGAPGPFAQFSLLDKNGNKTRQYDAYRKVIENKQ